MQVHNPHNLPTIDIHTVQDFQGNLKDLDGDNHDKMLRVLTKRGFMIPLYVWKNPADGQFYMIDGHQRKRVIEHNELSPIVPYIEIPAANEHEAKEILLEQTSQYGTITPDGLDEFAALAELEVDELDVNFDAINLEKLWAEMNPSEPDDVEAAEPTENSKTDKVSRWSLEQLRDLAVTFTQRPGPVDVAAFLDWLSQQ